MFASRIGSATATISSGASTSRQRTNQGGASSVYGPPGGRSVLDKLEAAATALAVSAESSASLVARGVLTRPEYTTGMLGPGCQVLANDTSPQHLAPRTPPSG